MKKIADHILTFSIPGLMFCIMPVPGMEFAFSWQLAAIWLAGLIFSALLPNWWYRIFFLLALLRTATLPPVMEGYIELLMIALFLAAAQGFERIDPAHLLNALGISGILLMAWILNQQIGVFPAFFGNQSTGPFNPNRGGIFLALCLPAYFRKGWWMAILPLLVAIGISRTTTGMLAAALAIAIYISLNFMSRKEAMTLVAVLLIFGSLWFWKIDPAINTVNSVRWPAWRIALNEIKQAPQGRGLGSWKEFFPLMASGDPRLGQVTEKKGQRVINNSLVLADNEYLQAAFELGIPAYLLIMGFLGFSAFRLLIPIGEIQGLAASGLGALAIGCFGSSPMHDAPVALLACVWLGLWHRRDR